MNTAMKFLSLAVALALSGCSGESDEAKKLGFSSVEEMKAVHAKGWHTKERFNKDGNDTLNVTITSTPMQSSIDKKREIDEDLTVIHRESNGLVFYKPNKKSCEKVDDITTDFAEGWAEKSNVPVRTIQFLRVKIKDDDCTVIIDTPTGPKECLIGSIVKNSKGNYLVSTYHVSPDGARYVLKGNCVKPW